MRRNGFKDYRFQHEFCNGQGESVIPTPGGIGRCKPPIPAARISFLSKPWDLSKGESGSRNWAFQASPILTKIIA